MSREHAGRRNLVIACIAAIAIAVVSCEDPLAPPDPLPVEVPGEPALIVVPSAAVAGAPIAIDDAYATTVDVPLVISAPGLLANDLDTDGGTLILNSAGPLNHGRFTSLVTNGSFTYEPDPGFIGTETFTYLMRDDDGNFADPATVTIEVLPDPNRAPIGIPNHYVTFEGVALSVAAPGLLGNDVDPDGDGIILNSAGPLTNGRFTSLVTNGSFTYEPNAGFTGTETFTYLMRDVNGVFATPTTVTIQVIAPGGTTPVGIEDAYVTTEGVPLAIAAPGFLANDIDPDGGILILNSAGPLTNGGFTSLVTNGSFTYEPDAGFVGTESFTYLMRDDDDNFAAPTPASIEVLPDPNRAPIGIPDYYATLEGVPLVVPAPGLIGNDVDPDGDVIILNSAGPLSNGRFTTLVTNGSFTYEPDPGFAGREEFTYMMRDEHGVFGAPVTVVIDVITEDVTPPEIVVPADPIMLWPPNHRYHTIQVADLVSAVNDDDPDLSPDDVVIVSVTSDEVDNDGADGNTINDMVIGAGCRSVDLRMERVEGGNGRVYVIQFAAEDASGNVGEAFVRVHVPADRMSPAIEDAPANLVTGGCPTS